MTAVLDNVVACLLPGQLSVRVSLEPKTQKSYCGLWLSQRTAVRLPSEPKIGVEKVAVYIFLEMDMYFGKLL
jgi:hypothetical protein